MLADSEAEFEAMVTDYILRNGDYHAILDMKASDCHVLSDHYSDSTHLF